MEVYIYKPTTILELNGDKATNLIFECLDQQCSEDYRFNEK